MAPCDPDGSNVLDTVIAALGIVGLFLLMLSLGCHINFNDIAKHLKRPWSIILGMACQYILLPLVAFCGALAFSLDPNTAVGFMIGFTCPGGGISSIATLIADGDFALRYLFPQADKPVYSIFMRTIIIIISKNNNAQCTAQ